MLLTYKNTLFTILRTTQCRGNLAHLGGTGLEEVMFNFLLNGYCPQNHVDVVKIKKYDVRASLLQ